LRLPRNILILGAAQVLGLAGAPLVILVGGILGGALAPTPALATLPIATFVIGTAMSAVPAALWMRRVGRRAGFITGALIGTVAALCGMAAVTAASFIGFIGATLLFGASIGFVQQYRFAAVESVDASAAGRAVSFVLLGGVIGGFLGPDLVRRTRTLLPVEYAGPFLALAVLCALAALLFLAFRDLHPADAAVPAGPRAPLREILRQPGMRIAVFAGVVAYAVMSFIMTATPISMHVLDGHSVDATARVIQAHVIAMFTPSLFSGLLIDRLGPRRMMTAGAFAMLACIAIAGKSHAIPAYIVALALLGVGWNFLFVGGTVLLSRTWQPAERFRVQATNDFIVFGTQAIASLSAGAALHGFGWTTVNLITLPLLVAMLAALAVTRTRTAAAAAPTATPA